MGITRRGCALESFVLLEKLRATDLCGWLPPEGVEMFENCFDLEAAVLPAGQVLNCAGRLGLVLSGEADCGGTIMGPGDLVGAARAPGGQPRAVSVAVRARRDSEIALWDGAVLTSVCYRACWFHGRFVQEVEKRLRRT